MQARLSQGEEQLIFFVGYPTSQFQVADDGTLLQENRSNKLQPLQIYNSQLTTLGPTRPVPSSLPYPQDSGPVRPLRAAPSTPLASRAHHALESRESHRGVPAAPPARRCWRGPLQGAVRRHSVGRTRACPVPGGACRRWASHLRGLQRLVHCRLHGTTRMGEGS